MSYTQTFDMGGVAVEELMYSWSGFLLSSAVKLDSIVGPVGTISGPPKTLGKRVNNRITAFAKVVPSCFY